MGLRKNVKRERFFVKDVKAKVQAVRKDLVTDFHLCIQRDVESTFNPLGDGNVQLTTERMEKVTLVPSLERLDEWIIKIDRELSETSICDGNNKICEKFTRKYEALEKNKMSPIIQAIIVAKDGDNASRDYEVVDEAFAKPNNGWRKFANETLVMNEYIEMKPGPHPISVYESPEEINRAVEEEKSSVAIHHGFQSERKEDRSTVELSSSEHHESQNIQVVKVRVHNETSNRLKGHESSLGDKDSDDAEYMENQSDESSPTISVDTSTKETKSTKVSTVEDENTSKDAQEIQTVETQSFTATESSEDRYSMEVQYDEKSTKVSTVEDGNTSKVGQEIQTVETQSFTATESSEDKPVNEVEVTNNLSNANNDFQIYREILSGQESAIEYRQGESPHTEGGRQTIRELFHMDVSELVIERERR